MSAPASPATASPFSLTPLTASSAKPPFATSIAIVVGIDQYGNGIPKLRTAANDARRVARTLAELHGYQTIELIDEDATQERLTRLLTSELPSRVGPDDRVLFYYAGHGVALDGDSGPNGYLLPSDARRGEDSTFVRMPLVHDALVSLPCRHMLVVLDACFSGAFRWSGTRAITRVETVIHQEKYERFVHDPAWQVITSASQDEFALDQLATGALGSRGGSEAHSPFAMALFRALDGSADVIGRDGLVTATELFVYLDDALQEAAIEAGKRQTPGIWPLRKHGKGQFVFFVPNRELTLPPAPPLTYENNPWRGLASYERSDAALFFGRDGSIDALTTFVTDHPFTVLLGASGTGKSSLMKAGVLPRFDTQSDWHVLPVVRLGGLPMSSLADTIGTLDTARQRPSGADQIAAVVAAWCAENPARRLVLMIDQTEELVTMARTPADSEKVLALIARLLDAHGDQLRVVLTLRTDFEPQFDRSVLAPRWKNARFVIKPMSRADLQAVIEEPAARSVLYFDPPELVDALLDEVTNMPGALPLLSFALSEMYVRYINRRGSDRALTRDDYNQLGGVVGALRARADEEYHALDPAHQATMQRMLLRMVGGGGGNLARRRVSGVELVYRDVAENARVAKVQKAMVAARLFVEGKDTDGDPYVEPAHDALVRSWGRLIQWIQQAGSEVVPLVTRQKLAQEAIEWRRAPDKATRDGLLWKDPVRSAMLAPVVRDHAPWLNDVEMAFARDSVSLRNRTRRLTRGVGLLVAMLGIVSFVMWRQAVGALNDAQVASRRATLSGLVADTARGDAIRALAVADSQRRIAVQNAEAAERNADEARRNALDAQQNAERELIARARADTAAREAERQRQAAVLAAQRAEAEKARAVRSLFSSLSVFLKTAKPGSICVRPECGAPRIPDPESWIVISRLPPNTPGTSGAGGRPVVRDFIVARAYGDGNVLVYAHDGMTNDSEVRGRPSDNLLFAENAFRWLMPVRPRPGCRENTIVLWPGYVHPQWNAELMASVKRRGWSFVLTNAASLPRDLRCAGIFWFGNDWEAPANFGTVHVPVIERFVRSGGGLLVAGLGWSWRGNATGVPYPGNLLGQPFGFQFTRDYFDLDFSQAIPLMTATESPR